MHIGKALLLQIKEVDFHSFVTEDSNHDILSAVDCFTLGWYSNNYS